MVGRPLPLARIARATREDELHADVHDVFDRVRGALRASRRAAMAIALLAIARERLNLAGSAGAESMDLGFRMHAERTPNPNSIKWVLGRPVVEGAANAHFESAPSRDVSPLAARLFEIDGVVGAFLASNFVTVTKRGEVEWTDIAQSIVDAIKGCLAEGGSALGPAYVAPDARGSG